MSSTEKKRPSFRLTPEQDRRLERASSAEGQTKQAFALMAIMRGVEDAEAKTAARRKPKGDGRPSAAEPTGLGLTFNPPAGLEIELDAPPPDGDTAPARAATGDPAVATLAAWVRGGATDGERRRRLATAADVLRASPETCARAPKLAEEVGVAAGLDSTVSRLTRLLRGT